MKTRKIDRPMKHALLPAALLIAAGVLCTNCKTKMKISTLPYPVARMDSTVDDYFGTKVPDPYRWLEDDNSAETAAWVTAENEVTQNYLSQIPFRDKIRNRLTELWNYPKYGVPSKHGDYFFFFENDGLQNQSVLYRQKSLDGPAEVFLDPNKLSDDGTVALSDVSFSKDGKYCAYAAASSGSDWVEIRVMDVATRELLPDVIRWVKFSGAVWTRDGFYYSGYDEPKQSEALVAQNRFQKIFFHKLGTEQSADRLIYEDRAHPLRYVSAEVSKDDRHLFVFATEGTSGNEVLWADLSKGAPEFEVLFPGFANDYALVHARDGRAVFYTNEGAPRYRLVQADLNGAEPVLSELLPESELLLEGASVAGGSLFALYLDKAQSAVSQYDLSGKKLRDLKLPGIGAATGFADNDQEPFTFYSFSEFTRPASIYRYDIATGESSVFKTPDLKFDPDRFTAEQVFFDSKDGTPVSMFLVHRKDMKLDINNPEEPKILCVGNNPDRQNIYGAALGLYNSRIVKLINKKGQLKSSVIIDELPTIYFKGLDNLIATARSNKVAVCLGFQDFSQLVRDYGDKEAKVVINTVGNIFSGQVVGETAKTLSERFGKVLQKRQSISINRQDVSTSINTQMDSLIPPSKISGLTQGMFVGSVSDNFTERIEQKIFHAEIVVDTDKVKREESHYQPIPIINDFKDTDGNDCMKQTIQDNYNQIKEDVKQIVKDELGRIANDENLKHLIQKA